MSILELTIDDRIATITLGRPECHNAIDSDLLSELESAIDRLERQSDELGCLVLQGRGRSFCSGADLHMLRSANLAGARTFMLRAGWAFRRLERLPMPVVAVATGYCLGGGFELILHADVTIGSDDLELGFPEVELGLVTTAGSVARLIAAVGKPRATDILLSSRRIDAGEAVTIGLVSAIASRTELDALVSVRAKALCAQPASSVRAMKELLRHASDAHARSWVHELEQFEQLLWQRPGGSEERSA